MKTTDLANTSISTVRLVEFAILGIESRIMDLMNMKARLQGELIDLRRGELPNQVEKTSAKLKGRPPIPTPCKQCGKMCPSGLAARGHCVGKAKTPQKKVAETA